MQSVLKIMPDPIQEVPRDGASQSNKGLDGYDSGYGERHEFKSLYDEQLQQNDAAKQKDQGGNEASDKRQDADGSTATKSDKLEHVTRPMEKTGPSAKEGQVETKPMALVAQKGKPDGGQASEVLDQLMSVVQGSDKFIRQSGAKGVDGAEGLSLTQNKLTIAIDSAMAGQTAGKGSLPGDKGVIGELLADLKAPNSAEGEGESQAEPMDAKSRLLNQQQSTPLSLQQKLAAVQDQTPGIMPPKEQITDGALDPLLAKEAAKQTTGAQLKGFRDLTLLTGQADGPAAAKTLPGQTPDIIPNLPPLGEAATDAKVQRPMDMAAKEGKNGLDGLLKGNAATAADGAAKSNPNQTPDIVPPDQEPANVSDEQTVVQDKDKITRPFEMAQASKSGEPKPAVANDATAAVATANAVGDKVERPVANVSDKRSNILGKASQSKTSKPDSTTQGGDNVKMPATDKTEQKLMEANQEQQQQQPDADELPMEELFATVGAKELTAATTVKGPGPFSTTLNQFAVEASNSVSQTTTAKAAEKLPAQVTENLNMARPDLSQNMKERLTIMMNKGIQSAEIRLDPAELGQMQVKMIVENDVTSVSFVVQNAQAKEMLEQAMPKLREMMAEQGVEMGEGSVSQQEQQEQELGDGQNNGGGHTAQSDELEDADIDGNLAHQVKITNGALGGIDFFA